MIVSVLLTAGLGLSLLYGFVLTHRPPSLLRAAVKTLATLSLAAIAIVEGTPTLLVLALLLGAMGDAFLSMDGETGFLAGLGAFLVGHVAYIGLMLQQGAVLFRFDHPAIAVLVMVAIGLIIQLRGRLGGLLVPVALYIAVSVGLGIAAINLPLADGMYLAVAGVALFLLSDVILAQHLFVLNDNSTTARVTATILWLCYWCGQGLILAAFVS